MSILTNQGSSQQKFFRTNRFSGVPHTMSPVTFHKSEVAKGGWKRFSTAAATAFQPLALEHTVFLRLSLWTPHSPSSAAFLPSKGATGSTDRQGEGAEAGTSRDSGGDQDGGRGWAKVQTQGPGAAGRSSSHNSCCQNERHK